MKRIRGMVTILAGVMLAMHHVHAQQPQEESLQGPVPQQVPFVFFEPLNLAADDTALSRVDVPYRIDGNFFIAVRNADTSFPFPFKKRGEVLIELFDEKGVSKVRDINRFDIGEQMPESEKVGKNWYQNIASFHVPPGEYTLLIEVVDLESERRVLDRNRKILAQRFSGEKTLASTPAFVRAHDSTTLTLMNFGGDLAFGGDASIFLQLYAQDPSPGPLRVEYTVSTQPFLFRDPETLLADTLELPVLAPMFPDIDKSSASPAYRRTGESPDEHTISVLVPLNSGKLPLRPFDLEMKITRGKDEWRIKKPFRMVWPEMPMSLRDIDFALEVLRHITRESELDSLKSGSRDERLKHLEEFWRQKDRSPDTEYNEVMVEYYRRTDYAQRTFSSMKGGDGYKTDRGRIYILHGPPTRIDRSLDPSAGFQELWLYEKQNKRFIFRDQSKSGNYVLIATQNL